MDYKILPMTKSRSIAAGKKAESDKASKGEKKTLADNKEKEKQVARKDKNHSELIKTTSKVSNSIDNSSENLFKAIALLSEKVGLELKLPELVEGDKISKSINESAKIIEKTLSSIVQTISKIKLETQKTRDISPNLKELSQAIAKNSLKQSISELSQSVADIRLETNPQIIEWEFGVSRDDNGSITKITANAISFMEESDG